MGVPEHEEKKKLLYENFKRISREAFQKYKVVHLHGIRLPQDFSDLLPAPETTYKDVVWLDNHRPRSNQFAILKQLTDEQKELLSLDIQTEVEAILLYFNSES